MSESETVREWRAALAAVEDSFRKSLLHVASEYDVEVNSLHYSFLGLQLAAIRDVDEAEGMDAYSAIIAYAEELRSGKGENG